LSVTSSDSFVENSAQSALYRKKADLKHFGSKNIGAKALLGDGPRPSQQRLIGSDMRYV
jgi:hypothetical protein